MNSQFDESLEECGGHQHDLKQPTVDSTGSTAAFTGHDHSGWRCGIADGAEQAERPSGCEEGSLRLRRRRGPRRIAGRDCDAGRHSERIQQELRGCPWPNGVGARMKTLAHEVPFGRARSIMQRMRRNVFEGLLRSRMRRSAPGTLADSRTSCHTSQIDRGVSLAQASG